MNDNFDSIYLKILNKNKINCFLSETILPIFFNKEIHIDKKDIDNLFLIDNNLKTDYVITEDVYKKLIFKSFIDDVRNSEDIIKYSIDRMKNFLFSKLKPIKTNIGIIVVKYNFDKYDDFVNKMNRIVGKNNFKESEPYFKNIFNQLKLTEGACWAPNFAKSCGFMFMFLNINFSDITLMHETIHYIQTVTGRSIVKQKTKLEKQNNLMFTTSKVVPYVNSFCHLIENDFSKEEILRGFGNLLKIERKNISKNEFIKKKCINTPFLNKLLKIHKNDLTCVEYILTCIYENKHISLIRSHLINYF